MKQIKAGQPVFFGCDVGQFSDCESGIMDTALFEYEVRLGSSLAPLARMCVFLSDRLLCVHRPRSTSSSG